MIIIRKGQDERGGAIHCNLGWGGEGRSEVTCISYLPEDEAIRRLFRWMKSLRWEVFGFFQELREAWCQSYLEEKGAR